MHLRQQQQLNPTRPQPLGRITVGWTNTPAADVAARWAAQHAHRTGRLLTLVHEEPTDQLDSAETARVVNRFAGAERAASQLLALAAGIAEQHPGLGIVVMVQNCDLPAAGLEQLSAQGDLLVLGTSRTPHPRTLGSLVDHLSATSDIPVARIPETLVLSGPFTSARSDRMVVGFRDSVAGRAALAFAVAEARRLSCFLTIIAPGSDLRTLPHEVINDAAVGVLESALDPVRAAEFLLRTSEGATLLIVGCHHQHDPWAIRLGPCAQTVVDGAAIPVVTVGRRPEDL